jgi:hypothetical protein
MLLVLVLLLSHLFLFILSSDPVYTSRTDGSWLGFGHNGNGQLGLDDTTDRNTPTTLPALGTRTVKSCVLGGYHTLCKK